MDLSDSASWLLVIAGCIGLLLFGMRSVRHLLGPPMLRFGSWALARLSPVDELDQEADDLSKVLRREQLCAEVERLRRTLATDESMSATRQIANRLAYRQLLRELENTPAVFEAMPSYATATRWNSLTLPSRPPSETAPTVEILEIGGRRKRVSTRR
jgi:hypothetical protein